MGNKFGFCPRWAGVRRGQLAQLVRAQHSHCWGHWFESSIVHIKQDFANF